MRLKPKKSLGQNFLIDRNIRKKIVSACDFSPEDVILEIGPGRGELTAEIAQQVKKVFAVEIDHHLCAQLKGRFCDEKKIEIIHADILKFDLNKLKPQNKKIKIVGNIPYYISTPIIEYIIERRGRIASAYLTVQKEFAGRIVSGPGSKEFGALSCFVQYYLKPEIVFDIKKGSFFPVPKVASSFLKLEVRSAPAVKVEDEEYFFKIIRSAFNQRRKILRNSLAKILSEEKLGSLKLKRPEELSLEDFSGLAGETN
ncbi:MAG: 16S rRNA (adenine(1518)-N(6)/adenine(1519)-N(6))-dimethyltransferase RsmA [Candidatus Omnitrophica bacterium]|nr:16S rRNA (adenine(1518)-N(6)/adenine(1519)-N(6))-dimethyltransferase RsmA [Candidatus Omnitrophota bacterium]MDD5652972.1 16S rRNA (adenine(1518)-N(6)/adenine(1519)-N(6))-dimethyltransferase RsmA [Candidatus Omnitrophota bacterium]